MYSTQVLYLVLLPFIHVQRDSVNHPHTVYLVSNIITTLLISFNITALLLSLIIIFMYPIFTFWWSSCFKWGIVVSVVFLDFVKHFSFSLQLFCNVQQKKDRGIIKNKKITPSFYVAWAFNFFQERKKSHTWKLIIWLEFSVSLKTWTIFNFCHICCCLSISPVCQRVDTISVVC